MGIIYGNVKPTFMEIYPDWNYITKTSPKKTVLKAGTPISALGRLANNGDAIGLVAENTGVSDNPISIIVGGAVSLAAVQSSYTTLTAACKQALKGILFINSSGKVDTTGSLPPVSSTDNGKVATVSGGVWSAQTPSGGGGTELLYFDMQYPATFYRDPNDEEETPLTVAQVTAALADNPTAYAFFPLGETLAPVFGAVLNGHLVLNYFVDGGTELTLYNVDCDPYNPMGGYSTLHAIAYVG